MRRMLIVAGAVVLGLSSLRAQVPVAAPLSQVPEPSPLEKLEAANNLEFKGNLPFDLVVSFQLFDMEGNPKETGSFERWWGGPDSTRWVVHMPGLDEDGKAPAGADVALQRDAYLIGQLLEGEVRPVMLLLRPGEELKQVTVTFGKATLDCLTQLPLGPTAKQANQMAFCTDPKLDDVRVARDMGNTVSLLRNGIGKFHNTFVATDLHLALFGRTAITGKVTSLHGFEPPTSEVKLPTPASLPAQAGVNTKTVAAGVMAGRRVSFVEPEYPMVAKIRHLSGSVLLRAVIGKDGSLHAVVPIASTDSLFVNAAVVAVKQWKYSPYLLNGAPAEVDTTVTLNFALN